MMPSLLELADLDSGQPLDWRKRGSILLVYRSFSLLEVTQ
jgi:hypothetical protein